MALPQVVTLGPSIAAANAALFAASQTPVSGTPLTLTGASQTGGQFRTTLLTYGSEAAPRTLMLTGLNPAGGQITELLSIPAGATGTVATNQIFTSILSAVPGGGGFSAAVTLGTNSVVASPWKIVDLDISPPSFSFQGTQTGVVTWTINLTNDNPNSNSNQQGGAFGNSPVPPASYAAPVLQSQTASAAGVVSAPFYAWQLVVTAGGTGAGDSITVKAIQAGFPIR